MSTKTETRYTFELDNLKQIVNVDTIKEATQKGAALKETKKVLKEK
jgi:hypothetical protein